MQAVQRETLDLHISFPVFHVCFTLCSQLFVVVLRVTLFPSCRRFFSRVPSDRRLAPSPSAVGK